MFRANVDSRILRIVSAVAVLAASLGVVTTQPSSAAPGDISGVVFNDLNSNGTNDGEPPVSGVTVTAFDASGAAAATTTTNSSGAYTLNGLTDATPYRVEFTTLPTGWSDGPAGPDSNTSITFATPETTGIDFGLHEPVDCDAAPPSDALLYTNNAAVSCSAVVDPAYPKDAFGLIDITNAVPAAGRSDVTSAVTMFHHPDWHIDQLGNIFGIAIDTQRGDIFTSASSNYSHEFYSDSVAGNVPAIIQYGNIGGGANDVGAAGTVYQLDAVTGAPTVFVQLPQQASTFSHVDCESDSLSAPRTTGVGLGNVVYDETNDQLFISSWEDGFIYRVDMAGNILDAYDFDATDDGTAGMANGQIPYGLELSADGSRLYFGTVFGLEVWSIDLTLAGAFSGTTSTVGGVTVFENHGSETLNQTILVDNSGEPLPGWLNTDPHYYLSDLELLPSGEMLAGIRVGCNDSPHSAYNHRGQTHVLTADGAGVFDGDNGALDVTVTGDAGLEDNYGGVGYYERPDGTVDYAITTADALSEAGPHGLTVFHEVDAAGTPISPLGAIDYGTPNDPKGIAGDVEVFSGEPCSPSPLEIGNFVWLDLDQDGIQDPDELPLAGVAVTLYAADGTTVVATTTTDANGEYHFDTTDGLLPNTGYEIDFDVSSTTTALPGGAVPADLSETAANTGAGSTADLNDSDVVGDRITLTTGGSGQNDHSFDAGYALPYDLALTKVYNSDTFGDTTDGVIESGSDVTFTITVFNQGSVDAASFEVTDYLPAGFVLNDGAWTDNADGTATYSGGPLAAGTSVPITITLTADSAAAGDHVNWAEISVDDGVDVDSTPNGDLDDDAQPVGPGAPTDDEILNAGGDEDDHDPAGVTVAAYDLALTKVYTSDSYGGTADGVVQNGSDVTFTITVLNQGTIDAASFEVTDYLPAGFVLNDGAWTDNADGTATYSGGPLTAGTSVPITITLRAVSAAAGDQVNWAEISADDGIDIDSTPNDDPDDDAQPVGPGAPTDDEILNAGGDEDDHDPAGITVESYDLALTKVYTSDTSGNATDGVVEPGDDVTFTITVFNQGTIDAASFEVTDYLPAGFVLNDGAWADNADGTATYAGGPLAAGASVPITIILTADVASDGDHVNWAEISADDGVDVDSTPNGDPDDDAQPVGPGAPTDDEVLNAGGDEDDHDPAGVTVAAYDLALTKVYTSDTSGISTDGVVQNGTDVLFTITVFNQGTADAASFEVTDYLPAGFVLNDGAWADNADGTATYAGGPLAAGASVPITITLTADSAVAGDHVNWAEISADDGTDVDSTPNTDPDDDTQPVGPGAPTDDEVLNAGGDEDDHDPAGVTVAAYDLALTKVYTSDTFGATNDGVIDSGADVTFTITVFNQGSIDAASFEVTDYLPAGFVLNDGAWADNADGTATYAGGPLTAGASVPITITLTADSAAAGDHVNWAEISADDGTDGDSTPNTDPDDDAQPVGPGAPTDDEVLNAGGDEDDHDPAGITVESYDLALTKVYTSDTFGATNDGVIDSGADVTFTITVFNQGSIDAASFEVTDYLPAGFVLNDGAWADNADGTATYAGGPLTAGASVPITITLTADSAAAGDHVNWAEISADDGTDGDSTPNTDPDDDAQPVGPGAPTDDEVLNAGGDEDDHDPAGITVANFDLALTKVYTSDTSGNATDGVVEPDGDVTFTITVFNQGTIDAASFEVTDYLPAGFVLNDGAWTDNADGTATYSGGPLTAGTSVPITITLTAETLVAGEHVNWAEISADDGTDIDSTPNTDPDDDAQPVGPGAPTDDEILNAGGDEDDHDLAGVSLGYYDLALIKVYTSDTFGSPNDGVVEPGADVTFTIAITNQGTIDAASFEVTDYLPAGFVLNDGAWTDEGSGVASIAVGPLAAGDVTTIDITLTALVANPGTHVNWAEISADDGTDVDSTPNTDPDDDNQPGAPGDVTDNEIDNGDDASGDPDEDDHDLAGVSVANYDLALTKVYTSDTTGSLSDGVVAPGGDVTFTITVFNQGTVDAASFEVTDYLPAGFVLNDGAWSDNADGTATYSGGPLAAGTSVPIGITLTADGSADGSYVNWAEISADDGNDIDSDTDIDPDNDFQPVAPGDPTDNEIGNADRDEDDHDPAGITVEAYDLALTKVYTSDTSSDGEATDGRIRAGDDVTFTMTVFNQGTVDAASFEVTDYLPAGFVLNDGAWSDNADGTATYSGGPLAAGTSVPIGITLTADGSADGSYVNWAEISADDGDDLDSTPNTDPDDDAQPVGPGAPTDDEVLNAGGDEDDHDPAGITVESYDLALTKVYTSDASSDGASVDGAIEVGDDVTFTITVFNQGSIDAASFEVTDYLPAGFVLNDGAWADNADGTATYAGGPLAAGASVPITITLTAAAASQGAAVNWAEISTDDGVDFDSTPDTDPGNDSQPAGPGAPTDNAIDNVGGDEDDHDVAGVVVGGRFDLAFRKTVDPSVSIPVVPGQDVTFLLSIINQGSTLATDIAVVDYIDTTMWEAFAPIDNPAGSTTGDQAMPYTWTVSGSNATVTVDGVLAPGQQITVPVTLTALSRAAENGLVNTAEIMAGTAVNPDGTPLPVVDTDSTPDQINSEIPIDDVIDGTGGDQDDHDIAEVPPAIFDLALRKQLIDGTNAATVEAGDKVTFELTIFNQGNTHAQQLTLVDYAPTGLTLSDPDWTVNALGDPTISLAGVTLAPGEWVTVPITFVVDSGASGNVVNQAEISGAVATTSNGEILLGPDAQPIPDIDSFADANDSETPVDDVIDNTSGDEDDHDLAVLALGTNSTIAFTGASTLLVAGAGLAIVAAGGPSAPGIKAGSKSLTRAFWRIPRPPFSDWRMERLEAVARSAGMSFAVDGSAKRWVGTDPGSSGILDR